MKIFLVPFVALALCLLSGCCIPNAALTAGTKAAWETIGPRYIEYTQNDPKLPDDIKADRIKTAEMLTDNINRLNKRATGK